MTRITIVGQFPLILISFALIIPLALFDGCNRDSNESNASMDADDPAIYIDKINSKFDDLKNITIEALCQNGAQTETGGNKSIFTIKSEGRTNVYYFINNSVTDFVSRDENGNGYDIRINENGTKNEFIGYKNGKISGMLIRFYKNNIISDLFSFVDGYIVGRYRRWAEDGTIIVDRNTDGKRISISHALKDDWRDHLID